MLRLPAATMRPLEHYPIPGASSDHFAVQCEESTHPRVEWPPPVQCAELENVECRFNALDQCEWRKFRPFRRRGGESRRK
jgi:hypothetical protein